MLSPEEREWIDNQKASNGASFQKQADIPDTLNEIDTDKVKFVLRRSLPVIVLILLLSGIGSWLYIRYTSPVFEAQSILKLDVKRESNIFGFAASEPFGEAINNLAGELELIKSEVIFDKLARMPRFAISYYYKGKILSDEKYGNSPFNFESEYFDPTLFDKPLYVEPQEDRTFRMFSEDASLSFDVQGKLGIRIEHPLCTCKLNETPHFEGGQIPGNYFIRINSYLFLMDYFSKNLQADLLNPNARTIKVSFRDNNRVKAIDIVNIVDSLYLEETIESKNRAADQTIDFLNTQLRVTDDSLALAEERIELFLRYNKEVGKDNGVERVMDQLTSAESAQLLLQTEISVLERYLTNIEEGTLEPDFLVGVGNQENNAVRRLVEEYNVLLQKLSRMRVSRSDQTLAIQSQLTRMQALRSQLLKMLKEEIARLKLQLSKERNRMVALEQELSKIPQKEAEYVRLRRHSDLYEKFYLLMMDRKAQYGINKAGTIPEFRVLSAASASLVPVFPRKWIIFGGAMSSGILISLLFVVLIYLISNTITGQSEAEKLLTVPVLGSIPKYTKRKLENSQLVIHENPKSQISEAFRSVRTNMEFIVPKKSGKIITITSTLSGEGKTFTAVNLGGIIAMAGQKVIVLDLDMRKPKLHLGFDTPNEAGMSTLLIGRAKLKECIKHSIVEGLDFITAGPIPPNPAELMMSEQLDKLLKDLAKAYDVVVIDTPPIGIVADAVLLMRKADIPIYVLRADFSKRIFCKNINRIKSTFHLNHLSVVLNSTSKGAKYGYGNVVSYGYGYYDEEQRSAMRRLVTR